MKTDYPERFILVGIHQSPGGQRRGRERRYFVLRLGGRVGRLTGRQKARTQDPPTCGGGLPIPRLPVFWPLSPRSERLGVRGLGNCLGVTDGIPREDFTASQGKTPKSWELQGVFSYWLNNPQHESRSTRFLLSWDLGRT